MNDTRYDASPMGPLVITFLAGATLGALLVALTTPKTGPDLRGELKNLARRVKGKAEGMAGEAGEAWDDVRHRTGQAAEDFMQGAKEAAGPFKA